MFDVANAPPIAFFYTARMACPYIEGETERRLVADLSTRRGRRSHDLLARAGFRRSQHLVYRPACPSCAACVPIRVRAGDFEWTRGFRRVWSRNADLCGTPLPATATREQYELFARYQASRHGDGEMALMDYADYAEMVERSPIETALIEHRDADGVLRAVMLCDMQGDGISAVYGFFEPEMERRSLGTYMVLDLVRRSVRLGLPFVYLGYWIAASRKMAYKPRFRPVEVLGARGWVLLPEDGSIELPRK